MADDKDDREEDADEREDEREDDEQAESGEDRTAASDDADDANDSDEGEGSDAAARRVAEALGVGEEAETEAGEDKAAADEAEDAPKNRAVRRREQAEERRKKRRGAAAKAADEPLPKDKNARAKELLKRRREQATANVSSQLLPSEMVDDALARGTSAVTRWLRSNFGVIQWFILAAIVAGGGFALYTSQTEKKAADATDDLMSGVRAQLGVVVPEDKAKENEDAEEQSVIKTYKTAEERSEAALAGYQKVVGEYPNTAAAILAQLGEAGVLLRKGEPKKALDAYNAVLASKLAAADLDVKGRALEGLGFAKEESGDLDGALASFKELQAVDASGFKELGTYHEARVLLAKGDKDKAKELFKGLYEKFNAPDAKGPQSYYLKTMVMQALRQLDPEMLKQPGMGPGGAGGKMSQEEIQRMLQEAIKKGQQQGQGQ